VKSARPATTPHFRTSFNFMDSISFQLQGSHVYGSRIQLLQTCCASFSSRVCRDDNFQTFHHQTFSLIVLPVPVNLIFEKKKVQLNLL
jgi:hypothetical protein